MKVNYLTTVVAVAMAMVLSSIPVRAESTADVRHESGEITWVDLKLGKLQLKSDANPNTGEINEYRITEHETRVSSPSDKKFLTIKDLQPGQHVSIDVIKGKEELIVKQITADPKAASKYQEAYGKVESVDGEAGTLTLVGTSLAGEMGESNLSFFLFDADKVVVMRSPSTEHVKLVLKPGDVVKVQFHVQDGKQHVHSITVYTAKVTSTTTTTTVTTTQ